MDPGTSPLLAPAAVSTFNKGYRNVAKHNVELVEQLRQSLLNRPAPAEKATALSSQKIVAKIADEVRALQAQGYTYAMIAAILSAGGLRISGGTLCTYMSRTKNHGGQKPKTTGPAPSRVVSPGATDRNSENGQYQGALVLGPLTQSSARFTPAPDTEDI